MQNKSAVVLCPHLRLYLHKTPDKLLPKKLRKLHKTLVLRRILSCVDEKDTTAISANRCVTATRDPKWITGAGGCSCKGNTTSVGQQSCQWLRKRLFTVGVKKTRRRSQADVTPTWTTSNTIASITFPSNYNVILARAISVCAAP